MEICKCPDCGATLYEDQDLVHDGYNGSPYAHDGRGSLGCGRHHYYFVCGCGWSERPDLSRRKASRKGHGENWNGVVLPTAARSEADCVCLPCRSRQNKFERWLCWVENVPAEHLGRGVGHSLAASYVYTLVTKEFYARAQAMFRAGIIELADGWDRLQRERREAIYNNDNH